MGFDVKNFKDDTRVKEAKATTQQRGNRKGGKVDEDQDHQTVNYKKTSNNNLKTPKNKASPAPPNQMNFRKTFKGVGVIHFLGLPNVC